MNYKKDWSGYIKGKKSVDDSKTHVSKITPKGSFYISNNCRDEFMDNYSKAVTNGAIVGMAEYPRPIMPVLSDLDLRFDTEWGITRRYTSTHILGVTKCYQDAINEMYLNVTEKNLRAVILEKGDMARMYSDNSVSVIKDGFHIHFPYCFIDNMEQRKYLRPKVISLVYERKILDDLKTINTVENIIDQNIPNVTWLMYLSRKEKTADPWIATMGVTGDGQECTVADVFEISTRKLTDDFLIKNLSVYQPDRPEMTMKPELIPDETDSFIVHQGRLSDKEVGEIKISLKKDVEPYLKIINPATWDAEREWMEIGWALYNISRGQDEGFDLWEKYSKKSSKFKEGECQTKWSRMKLGGHSLATIKWYAKRDNPSKYKSVNIKVSDMSVYFILDGTPYRVAKYIRNYYDGVYTCSAIKQNEWWVFKEHRWQKCSEGNELYLKIPEDIVKHISEYSAELPNQHLTDSDIADKRKRCEQLRIKLEDTTYLDKIMKMLKHMFFDPMFVVQKDTNNNLLCFPNGVLVMENKQIWFRDGRPTDMITMCMKTSLDVNMKKDDPRYIKTKKFLHQVFTNKNIRRYFKRWAASSLRGGNVNKLFVIWIGDGNNAKSITSEFLEEVFGELMFKFPIGTLIGDHAKGGAATADLVRMQGKRLAGFQEPPKGAKMNLGLLKEITGGDSMYVRGLFKEGHEVKPEMKTFLQCNHAPKAPTYDKAFYNRLRMVMFDSEFTPQAPLDEEEQFRTRKFPIDYTFRRFLPSLAPALMFILYKSFNKYLREGLIAPEEVMAKTNQYRKSNDTLIEFIDESIQYDGNEGTLRKCASLNDIYNNYKVWFKDNFPGIKVNDKQEFKSDLMERWGEPQIHRAQPYWMGMKLKSDDIDVGTKASGKKSGEKTSAEKAEPNKRISRKKTTEEAEPSGKKVTKKPRKENTAPKEEPVKNVTKKPRKEKPLKVDDKENTAPREEPVKKVRKVKEEKTPTRRSTRLAKK